MKHMILLRLWIISKSIITEASNNFVNRIKEERKFHFTKEFLSSLFQQLREFIANQISKHFISNSKIKNLLKNVFMYSIFVEEGVEYV
jgi:hypothetical protein